MNNIINNREYMHLIEDIYNNNELTKHGCQTSSSTDLIKRIHVMTDLIEDLLLHNDIDKVVMEEVRPEGGYGVGNLQTHRALMWLQASIAIMIHDLYPKVTVEYIYPSSWRAAIGIKTGRGIKRTSLKQADIDFVKEKYGIDVNDDEADAICIGYAQLNKISNEINWE